MCVYVCLTPCQLSSGSVQCSAVRPSLVGCFPRRKTQPPRIKHPGGAALILQDGRQGFRPTLSVSARGYNLFLELHPRQISNKGMSSIPLSFQPNYRLTHALLTQASFPSLYTTSPLPTSFCPPAGFLSLPPSICPCCSFFRSFDTCARPTASR